MRSIEYAKLVREIKVKKLITGSVYISYKNITITSDIPVLIASGDEVSEVLQKSNIKDLVASGALKVVF